MLKTMLRNFLKICGKSEVSSVRSTPIVIRTLRSVENAKKTKVFSDLDHSADQNFGKLIKELSKV